jgi:16S rRNA processing protein RimM
MHGDQMLIHLDGVDTPEEGKRLGGLKVRIRATDARPLEPGEYFLFQLIGLEAVTEEGAVLGTVTDLMETGAHDVLVITAPESPELLVPNHPNYVLDVAPERNTIVIRPPVYTS